ncbi:TetR family transcriptional regulator [Granulicatella seriolae]|jgi:AcrR family transcriptional regulator|uniref:TetR family transcriptional regulator n=1 Tax=Granulicatella seriolae TaxID=2967226 RepID=A0ABT1WP36_9LACT|nr:TetR family transcriptional regulator [Granulicatella seriolae]
MAIAAEVDIRTRRTRKLILDSFKDLLHEKTFESVRISDITNKAEINRATFYNHFMDKYQLLDVLTEETLLAHIRANLTENEVYSPDLMKNIYLTLTDFHTDMSAICRKNYVEDLALYTSQVLREEIKQTILRSIQLKYVNGDRQRLEALSATLSWFVIGLAYEWKRSKNISAEDYFERFREDYERLIFDEKEEASR